MRLRSLALAALLVNAAAPAGGSAPVETLHYRWRLGGLLGAIAGLFFPNDGEGRLTMERAGEDRFRGELLVTSEEEAGGDYFRYGAEWEEASGTTLRAWSSQRWRGKTKSKEAEIGEEGVVDVATAIFSLRRDPPREARRLEIWSDGKLYPVIVRPGGSESRQFEGRSVTVRHLMVRPLELPGRRVWKGELDLWLADDAAATPVEILVVRKAARVRLELVRREVGSHGTGVEGSSTPR